MAKSDYKYSIQNFKTKPFIVIEDLNKGRMSVTNDIENVIEEIAGKEKLNPVEHYILYKDSEGQWDGFNFSTGLFVIMEKRDFEEAVSELINHQFA
jgi:hypothetical protein